MAIIIMQKKTRTQSFVAAGLIAAVVLTAQPLLSSRASAAIVGTEQTIGAPASDADRARVSEFLAREDVRQQLQGLGVDADEALSRVDTMSQEEIASLVTRIDALPAGQGRGNNIVIILLLVVLILLLV